MPSPKEKHVDMFKNELWIKMIPYGRNRSEIFQTSKEDVKPIQVG